MSHIVLYDTATKRVVGTYRVQTIEHAMKHAGIYSSQLFVFKGLESFYPRTVEVGRACLAQDHRDLAAIITLWWGLGEYMNLFGQQYLFGCCSLTTQDPDDGWRAMKTLRQRGHLHPKSCWQRSLRIPAVILRASLTRIWVLLSSCRNCFERI